MQQILLVGKPNCGKTLLFNQLTGLRQHVANYPGVTVEVKSGRCGSAELIDLPGTYSLTSLSQDEAIAVTEIQRAVKDERTSLVVCVLDATRLESSLLLGLQMQALAAQHAKRVLFVLNFMDEVQRIGMSIDINGLSQALHAPIVGVSARTLLGIQACKQQIEQMIGSAPVGTLTSVSIESAQHKARQLAKQFGLAQDLVLKRQNSIDTFLLHSWYGGAAFLAVMFVLFQSIFTLAAPLMDGVESLLAMFAEAIGNTLPEGIIADFIRDALFGGVGSFLVFVPQIMMLTLIIGILDDSGYLARAALICHRPLSLFGLSGRSFIPYLSGHACAIPAIMAARTIESPHKRLMTILTIPLMSCSARLPVYALLITVLVPADRYLLGVLSLQAVCFFALYLFGLMMALVVAQFLNRWLPKDMQASDMPFILELPTYRLPHWKPLLHKVMHSGSLFIKRAAPIIFVVSVVIWTLGYFPLGAGLQGSWLGQLGQWIAPIFAPMGLDWRFGVAIIMSFLAREVFVGALGTLMGLENADEHILDLATQVQATGITLGAGVGLLLFYVIALQCVATVAMIKGETGSHRLAWGLYVGYGALAYSVAVLVNALLGGL